MFIGATLRALAYQLFKGWVVDNREISTEEKMELGAVA